MGGRARKISEAGRPIRLRIGLGCVEIQMSPALLVVTDSKESVVGSIMSHFTPWKRDFLALLSIW